MSISIRRPLLVTVITGVLYLLVLVSKQWLGFPELYQDENHYLPTALLFGKEAIPSLELLKTYNQLNTPLPFILGGWVIRIFGEEIQYLRLMNFILSFFMLLLLIWYKPVTEARRWLSMVLLLAMPSFYLCAIHYYTDMIAWAAVLLGVMAYLNKRHLAGCIFFIAAISSRQYMLAFPLAIVLFEFAEALKAGRSVKELVNYLLKDRVWIYYSVSIASLVPWILLWGGLAPAEIMKIQHYGTAPFYNVGFVVYASACVAFYFVIPETLIFKKWSYFTRYPRAYPRLFSGLLVLVIVLVVLFPARQAYNEYFTWPFLGYVDQLFETLGITGWFKQGIFGGLMLATLMRFIQPGSISLGSAFVLVNILLLGKAQLSWDKYTFPTLMILWFLAMHREDRAVRLQEEEQAGI